MDEDIPVLVIDEEPDMLELTATFLERESDRLAIETEQDATAAIDRAGEFRCLVSDLRMPEMDGIELCRRVREQHPSMPFLLFTAADRADIRTDDSVELTSIVQKGTGTDHYTQLVEEILSAVE